MNGSFMTRTAGLLALLAFCLLPLTGCSSGDREMQDTGDGRATDRQENVTAEDPFPPVPPEKAQLWEGLKNVARKDYDVCLEHCGADQGCLDRCASVYTTRLENDYKRVTQ